MTQGCPLAASLFLLAAEPTTHLYRSTVPDLEGTYTYADDQAMLLYSTSGLRKLQTPMAITSSTLALDVHHAKTTLVPLATDTRDPSLPALHARQALQNLGAPWADVRVATHATYLGYTIGPSAGTVRWTDPMNKWHDRSRALAASEVTPSVTLQLYASRCVPTLDYLAAMTQPPPYLARKEMQTLATVLRTPFCAYPRGLVHFWRELGLPSAPSLAQRMMANRMTTSIRLHKLWSSWASRLRDMYGEMVSLAAMHEPLHIEKRWDTPPRALVLEAAFCHGRDHPRPEVRQVFNEMLAGDTRRQSELYRALAAAAHGECLVEALRPRVMHTLALVCRPDVHIEVVDRALLRFRREARHHSPIFVLHAIRTWCNALGTSHRQQGGVSGCVWNCAPVSTDSLADYLNCAPLWNNIENALREPVSQLAKIGLDWDPDKSRRRRRSPLLPLALAVPAYHRRDRSASRTQCSASASLDHQVSAALRQLGALR